MNYYRITGYHPQQDFSFIIDCYGLFEKKWQFSSFLIQKGLKVLEVSDNSQIGEINFVKVTEEDFNQMFLRAIQKGKPEYLEQKYNGKMCKAIKVNEKIYIPDINK